MSADLTEAKQKLLDKLGSNYGVYMQMLGRWFRGQITKEEFDRDAKQLNVQNFVLEHNKFWLAFFHHCANSAPGSIQNHHFQIHDAIGKPYAQKSQDCEVNGIDPDTSSAHHTFNALPNGDRVRCLPNTIITHMKIFVIAWEMGLDSADDHVSVYINLALQHFLKNIITELISTKTAFRLRENRFKYALGVKPMNPYLNNSLKIYTTNLEYDPYQIESNKMNSSLVDTYAYNDSLFPSRLYEAQALYEFACSTTSVNLDSKGAKKIKLTSNMDLDSSTHANGSSGENGRRLTMHQLLIAFLSNKRIIPSQNMFSINLEKIFNKLSC